MNIVVNAISPRVSNSKETLLTFRDVITPRTALLRNENRHRMEAPRTRRRGLPHSHVECRVRPLLDSNYRRTLCTRTQNSLNVARWVFFSVFGLVPPQRYGNCKLSKFLRSGGNFISALPRFESSTESMERRRRCDEATFYPM